MTTDINQDQQSTEVEVKPAVQAETALPRIDAPPVVPSPGLIPLKTGAYKKKEITLFSIVALQIALVGSVVVAPAMTLIRGKEVSFETEPIDPYEMFRGDYVRLGYEMNRNLLSPAPSDGAIVYTALHKRGKFWHPRLTSTVRPGLLPGEVCIKGKYKALIWQIHYGIEQVFVPEKSGKKAEAARHLQVVAAVDAEGNAVIKRVDNGTENIYDASRVITGRTPAKTP